MHRILLFILLLLPNTLLAQSIPTVLVSVLPQKYLAERIANHTVQVVVIVPPGASPHSYEPTLKQVLATEKAAIWFRIGEIFELKVIKSLARKIPVIDQREGLNLITGQCSHCKEEYDTHVWLSPKLLKKMSTQLTLTLSELFPEHAPLYQKNCKQLLKDLDHLDKTLTDQLAAKHNRFILVSHPAFGYFCRDYNFEQVSIESEGKEISPQELSHLLALVKKEKIRHVLIQAQYQPKRAERIANEIGAQSFLFDPYAENVVENLRELGNILSHE